MRVCIVILLMLAVITTDAQDLHFSQNHLAPTIINPATTGMFDGDYKVSFITRNQWRSVTVPYNSIVFGLEGKRFYDILPSAYLALGLTAVADKAGDSEFSTAGGQLNIALGFNPGSDSTHFISIGIQPAMYSRSINFNKLQFDNQYDGDIYNPSLPNGEVFGMSDFGFFDLSAGLSWHYIINKRIQTTLGYSYSHINEPDQSFFEGVSTILPHKSSITAEANYFINDKFSLQPTLIFQRQEKFQQLLSGAQVSYLFSDSPSKQIILSTGTIYRSKDAFSVLNSVQYNSWKAGIAYDINVSSLNEASNGRGAIEFGVTYIYKTVKAPISKPKLCPVY